MKDKWNLFLCFLIIFLVNASVFSLLYLAYNWNILYTIRLVLFLDKYFIYPLTHIEVEIDIAYITPCAETGIFILDIFSVTILFILLYIIFYLVFLSIWFIYCRINKIKIIIYHIEF